MRSMIHNITAGKLARWLLVAGLGLVCLLCALLVPAAYAASSWQVTLEIQQDFEPDGHSTPPSESFDYELTPVTPAAPLPVGTRAPYYDFSVTGTDEADVGPITFPDVGEYIYELRCISTSQDGYSIDPVVYTIHIWVTNNDPTPITLVYLSDGEKVGDISFLQTYVTLASDPATMVDPPVKKTVNGNPSKASTFTFKLTPEKPSYPMPQGSANGAKTITVTGSGSGEFGTWSYTEEGLYHYTVTEVNTGEAGYTYDRTIYTIIDDVEAVGGQLEVTRTVRNDAGEQVTSLAFTNTYSAIPIAGGNDGNGKNPLWPKTGDATDPVFWVMAVLASGL
ncbi:MAG: hypothetical protein FWD72_00750, partial [Eggerthellaceae bacterium]|nr:hypothetical protein [Eggerthellaceae bacterium]